MTLEEQSLSSTTNSYTDADARPLCLPFDWTLGKAVGKGVKYCTFQFNLARDDDGPRRRIKGGQDMAQ